MHKRLIALASLGLTMALPVFAGPDLITAKEAALPAGSVPRMRGITRGPTVEWVAPNPQLKSVKAPFDFKVRFKPHGGRAIDLSSIQVLYVKNPTVDLSARLTPHVSGKGISIDGANAPPGQHTVVVSVADSSGHRGTSVIVLNVGE